MGMKVGGQNSFDKLIQLVKNALSLKVDKVDGKGLSTNDYTTAEKTKLGGIETGAEVNVQPDWDQSSNAAKDFIKNKPTDLGDFTNNAGYQKASDVQAAIRAEVGSVYVPQGTVTFAQLPSPAADKLGHVYNVSDAFTSTGSFVEGAGHTYNAGANVVCVNHGGIYLWDVLGGTFDLEELTAAEVQALWDSN